MERKIIIAAALMGMLAIILGAFGAHALKKQLTVEELVTFETGVKYQMYQALFLFFIGMNSILEDKTKKTIFWLVIFGVIFFSGSIYLLATKTMTGLNFRPFGVVTPFGGALLIVAWSVLLWNVFKKKR